MAVNGVTPTGTSSTTGTSATNSAAQSMGMSTDDFYKLLIAELQNQDPTQPMDNSKIVEQVAGIQNIQASTTMTSTLQTVTKQQNYATAASLIGRQVTGTVTDAAGTKQQVTGTVTSVTFEDGGQVVLNLDNGKNKLPLESITDVQAPTSSAQVAPAAPQQNQGLLKNLVSGLKAA